MNMFNRGDILLMKNKSLFEILNFTQHGFSVFTPFDQRLCIFVRGLKYVENGNGQGK